MTERKRVLIVDDEGLVHSAVKLVLRRDFDLVHAMSAEEALRDLEAELEAGHFDAVVLDVLMPGIPDGIDFFRRLQQIAPDRAPGVVFMTGDPHIAGTLAANERTTCIAKPFDRSELRRAVVSVIAERASARGEDEPAPSTHPESVAP